jgi:hypothetical protein
MEENREKIKKSIEKINEKKKREEEEKMKMEEDLVNYYGKSGLSPLPQLDQFSFSASPSNAAI